jgi:FlaA1/EpsC-like NDP-sugar epimerase
MKNVIIIGSGKAGTLLLVDIISHHKERKVIGVVDDEKNSTNLGPIRDLHTLLVTYKVDEILIAIPSARGSLVRTILLQCKDVASLSIRILPRNFEIVMKSAVSFEDTRPLEAEDIVGEHIEKENQLRTYKEMKGKSILITGAGGSIGSELAKQVALAHPKKLVLIDFSEYNLFHLKLHLDSHKEELSGTETHFILGDINNGALMRSLFLTHSFHTVFHAAAYKHVPALEENTYEAVHNNIGGTYMIASLSDEFKIKKCILISTDKAVKPKSIMGKTKKVAEHIMHFFNSKNKECQFVSVRFGNVFNSSGSAVEIFLKQIRENAPITITDGEMTRFFMTVHEAVHLVLQAWLIGKKQCLYMLEMSDPVSIMEIAQCLVIMQGHLLNKAVFTEIGKRAGEKKHEQLLDSQCEHKKSTVHKRIYAVTQSSIPFLKDDLDSLLTLIDSPEVKNHSLVGERKLKKVLAKLTG